ncbi:hypothetical protein [uncultured Campylobacter sp.]|uniref:hypothetical protein n=1 Tax=uncultured Campylobacter sp. TaxID=218934 RepID=UPI00260EA899|nr:hypothetical protein [uncultured Campylobacter sp.]
MSGQSEEEPAFHRYLVLVGLSRRIDAKPARNVHCGKIGQYRSWCDWGWMSRGAHLRA